MKRIARTIVVVSLATAATGAAAASTALPSSAQDTYSQYDVFPNMETYASRHSDSAERQAVTGYRAGDAGDNLPVGATSAGPVNESARGWGVGPRGQIGPESPFPSAGGPVDD